MRLSGTKATAVHQYRGLGNQLWDLAGNRPSLDLPFAETKSLVDATTGTNLIDFTRASSGTYVDSEGVIRTATTNLLLRSEEFGTTWAPTNATISANTATAPNGTLTADTLVEDNSTGGHVNVQTIAGLPDNTSFTASCYCKALTRSWVAVTVVGKDGVINRRWFNLSTGAQGATNGTVTNFSAANVGDGWYRIAVTSSSATGAGNVQMRISLGSADNTASYTGDGTSGIYLWGAQLEQSSTVGEYVPTGATINSAPRFDHNPTTGESLGLLVEESRSNLLLRSEEFDNAYWGRVGLLAFGSGSIADATTAPDGTATADLIVATTASGNHGVFIAWPGSSTRVVSVYVKPAGYSVISFSSSSSIINFDLGSETVSGASTDFSSGLVVPMPNGWYRVSAVITSPAGGNLNLLINNGSGITFTGDGTSGLYLWGAQLEQGSFPTSYIKNVDNPLGATRAADVASISGTNFSSWYRQDEGTVFAESLIPFDSIGTIASFDDGTFANRWQARFMDSPNRSRYRFVSSSGSYDYATVTPVFKIGSTSKSAFYAQSGDQGYSIDSNYQQVFAPQTTMPNISRLELGNGAAAERSPQLFIKRLAYWPQRLPNSTIQAITQ